jgi:hypothetical protein
MFVLENLGFNYHNLHMSFVLSGGQHEMKCLLM